jgi:hypothetical protein
MSTDKLEDIESTLHALLDSLRNAHLAIARGQGTPAIDCAEEAHNAARHLQSLVARRPEHLQATARLLAEVLESRATALKTLLEEVERKRAGPEGSIAFHLRPPLSAATPSHAGEEDS